MKLGALALAATLAASPAWAEPCPLFGLRSESLRKEFTSSAEGGIVVGEQPAPNMGSGTPTPDRARWTTRSGKATVSVKQDTIAPGLVVYRPPPNGATWELLDGDKKRIALGKRETGKPPGLLDAPAVTRVTSGTTTSRHPSQFVSVDLSDGAPKEAIALVLSKAKGPALSWGTSFAQAKTLTVYTTGGGCISEFPAGTVQAQPGDTVTLFWVDQYGRRSRVTPAIVVEKP